MEAKAVRVDTQLWGGLSLCARHALQAQPFLSRSLPERDAVGARVKRQIRANEFSYQTRGPFLPGALSRSRCAPRRRFPPRYRAAPRPLPPSESGRFVEAVRY